MTTADKKPERPAKSTIYVDNIPGELRNIKQWVNWKYVWNENKWTKIPVQLNGRPASVTAPETWCGFEEAYGACHQFDGVGFVLTAGDPYCAFDFDNCYKNNQIVEGVKNHIDTLESYTEITPSGRGLRVWVKAALPVGGRKKGDFEVYDGARYLTVTGNRMERYPKEAASRQKEVTTIWSGIFGPPTPTTVKERADVPSKFDLLWGGEWKQAGYSSPSDADMALCNILAASLGRNPQRVDTLFRASGLMRKKWDALRGHLTYGEITSRKSCSEPVQSKHTAPTPMMLERFCDILHRVTEEEDSWLLQDWLPAGGCGLMVGAPKNFKTWLSIDLALSVMLGRPYLGQFPVSQPGPVLMIQQEDPFRTLAARVARGMHMKEPTETGSGEKTCYTLDCKPCQVLDSLPLYWITSRDFAFSSDRAMELLDARLEECRPVLCIIDPMYVAAGKSDDYFAGSATKMNSLKVLRDKHNCAFLVVHHTTWAGRSSEDAASMWGSIYLDAWLEFGWLVIETPNKNEGQVRIRRYFKEAQEPPIIQATFSISPWEYKVTISEDGASTDRKIREAVMEGKITSCRKLAGSMGIGLSTVSRSFKRQKIVKRGAVYTFEDFGPGKEK